MGEDFDNHRWILDGGDALQAAAAMFDVDVEDPFEQALVILTRWIRRRPLFTERDWLFLFGHPREKVLSLHPWIRFAVLWFAVMIIGFIEGYVLLPFGLASFLGAVFLTAFVVWRVVPKWLR